MKKTSDRDAEARLRFAIVGPLLAAPPEGRQLQLALRDLAARQWTHPGSGTPMRFGVSTIERWYYLARTSTDPLAALRRRVRLDKGRARVLPVTITELVRAQYREHPGWTAQLHHVNLTVLVDADGTLGPMPSYSTVRRFLRANGLERQPTPRRASAGAERARDRHERLETRSYEAAHVNGLWHLDFHHGSRPVLEANGRWLKPRLLGVIDDHSRLVCHLQWYRNEDTESLVHGFCQALARRSLPRALMSDNGSAMVSAEFTAGLESLGIVHERTLPLTPSQNGKQESFWGNVEGRLLAMLESSGPMSLEELNRLTFIWVEGEYNKRVHSEIAATPLSRFLASPSVGRDAPDMRALARAFRQRGTRRQRRSDGTLSLAGKRFEVPARFSHLARVPIAWARWNLADVEIIDPDTGAAISPLHPLDREANADGRRRRRETHGLATDVGASAAASDADEERGAEPSNTLAPLMEKLVAEFVATGVPPGFTPSPGPRSPTTARHPGERE